MNIEAAVQAATARVVASINRSAGQHSRAIAKAFKQLKEKSK